MAVSSRDLVLSLLAAANNHGDLSVKLSSLKQAKDIVLLEDPSLAADLLPYFAELQSSPQSLVRESLLQIMEEIGSRTMEFCTVLMPVLLAFLRDPHPTVARQAIVSGTKFFKSMLMESVKQFHHRGKVDRWLEDLWISMCKFKDKVIAIVREPGSLCMRLVALKFLETYVLLFTPDYHEPEKAMPEGENTQGFNVSWLAGGHSFLDPAVLVGDAGRILGIILNLLPRSHPGTLTIAFINCIAAIARRRPQNYSVVLSALLNFNANTDTSKGVHVISVQYSVRTALLGFLRSTHPAILESREKLLRALRSMNSGDAAEQVVRQVEKLARNAERASRDNRLTKDDISSGQIPSAEAVTRKRPYHLEEEFVPHNQEAAVKRAHYVSDAIPDLPVQTSDSEHSSISVNGLSSDCSLSNGELSPVEQMIAMIGALLAEGERGAESLDILISKIHPDLLADIVITSMKHLPSISPSLTRLGNLQAQDVIEATQVATPSISASSVHSPVSAGQVPYTSAMNFGPPPGVSVFSSFSTESRRDPRRDPRRQDPRLALPSEVPVLSATEDSGPIKLELENFNSSEPPKVVEANISSTPSIATNDHDETSRYLLAMSGANTNIMEPKEEVADYGQGKIPAIEVDVSPDMISTTAHLPEDGSITREDLIPIDEPEKSPAADQDQHSPIAHMSPSDDTKAELPVIPAFVDLDRQQENNLRRLILKKIIKTYKNPSGLDSGSEGMVLIAWMIAQNGADDDFVNAFKGNILEEYQRQNGHELVLHILYHLQSISQTDFVGNSEFSDLMYEKFLLEVAESLLKQFPASDKSFTRLLCEAPVLPSALLKLLEDLCCCDLSDSRDKVVRDADRVTQGLGTVWNLILSRPQYRESCLDIALKCAVHSQDDVRAKAIRLVTNKLYGLSYASERIEQFSTSMLLSAIGTNGADANSMESDVKNEREKPPVDSLLVVSEAAAPESESTSGEQPSSQPSPSVSLAEAQRHISLFFALCTKKGTFLQLLFDVYGQAPKTVKQALHRHIPILLGALGSSNSDLLKIISDPPKGSENLLMLMLQILTEETLPSPELISTVKHLYETKFKDASILVPLLASFSKDEVLPIFPRLVDLPPEMFQKALAHMLQGTAHSGPALTPTEVLVAIHDIIPEKDGLPLKKVMDVCSACFEQKTVFTQQVLSKALNQMVDKVPLPLLFMRTVIQATDAFPTLVDFVMEILRKLVNKQVWKMPKLWAGFLKCISQTQPHSFQVLLQLPPPQLESSLNKYPSLRVPLAAFASQPSVKASLNSSTLSVLGLATDLVMQQTPHSSSMTPGSSSVQGTTTT
ncbi:hypothetical protein MLD38_024686 [Melastoma candidum]|uniref:Uncharacterized protein n=1 Tax=Melastoma candidum TaxID=119954 RepID=A0ACB9NVU6_9MYRT|nr:hypothetical protein MLD38_024686 [Melastoma candidum]